MFYTRVEFSLLEREARKKSNRLPTRILDRRKWASRGTVNPPASGNGTVAKTAFPADLPQVNACGSRYVTRTKRISVDRRAMYRTRLYRSLPPGITPRRARGATRILPAALSFLPFLFTLIISAVLSLHAHFRTRNGFRCRPPRTRMGGLA